MIWITELSKSFHLATKLRNPIYELESAFLLYIDSLLKTYLSFPVPRDYQDVTLFMWSEFEFRLCSYPLCQIKSDSGYSNTD